MRSLSRVRLQAQSSRHRLASHAALFPSAGTGRLPWALLWHSRRWLRPLRADGGSRCTSTLFDGSLRGRVTTPTGIPIRVGHESSRSAVGRSLRRVSTDRSRAISANNCFRGARRGSDLSRSQVSSAEHRRRLVSDSGTPTRATMTKSSTATVKAAATQTFCALACIEERMMLIRLTLADQNKLYSLHSGQT